MSMRYIPSDPDRLRSLVAKKHARRELIESGWHWGFVIVALLGAVYHEGRRRGRS